MVISWVKWSLAGSSRILTQSVVKVGLCILMTLVPQTLLAVGVLGVFLGHCRLATWIMAFGLTPVSEFSFVLASRGRRLNIISREVGRKGRDSLHTVIPYVYTPTQLVSSWYDMLHYNACFHSYCDIIKNCVPTDA